MPALHLLGTGAALSSPDRTTTMLAVEGTTTIAVDCGGDLVQRLLAGAIDLDTLSLLVLTHEHPDHISGFPLFMEKIWLSQRRRSIPVRGPRPAIRIARTLFDAFDTSGWKGLPEIEWDEVALEPNTTIWHDEEWRIVATPGRHSVPVVALRFEHIPSGGAVVYSADTEPSPAVARLAEGADLLVHEATGGFRGHTSATAAAEIAREAGVERLVLVHIPALPDEDDFEEAEDIFPGLEIGVDGARYEF